jgi:hypothetical protein
VASADARPRERGDARQNEGGESRRNVKAAAASASRVQEPVAQAAHEPAVTHKVENTAAVQTPAKMVEAATSQPAAVAPATSPATTEQVERVSALAEMPRPAASSQLSIRLENTGDRQVSLQVSERGGEVRVAVRSDDARLNTELRSDLNDLVSNLKQQGFKSETWSPVDSARPVASAERAGLNSSGGDAPSQGGESRQQQQQQRQNQQQARPEWFDELESSFGSAQNLQERR